MIKTVRTGLRIRERRMDLGIRQGELAAKAGISPSYLNLIEHDRRRIGGTLLADLARELGVEPSFLTQGAARAVLDDLRAAGVAFAETGAELARAEDLAARFPGWAALIAAQAARLVNLQRQVQMLTDRMSYDPALATSLHGVISAVTSIRSTAAILTSDEKIDADWQRRFHHNMHDDAVRLAATSEALMAYLETPEEAAGLMLSPLEEAELWLTDAGFHFPHLESGGEVADMLAAATGLRAQTVQILEPFLVQYRADAQALPLERLTGLTATHGHDPLILARDAAADLALVMRRLSALPAGQGHPPIGLVTCDAGGFLHLVRPVAGLNIPRVGACPLWPLFTALGQAGRPVAQDVVLSGTPEVRLRCTAIATQLPPRDFTQPPVLRALMLVLPDPAPEGRPAVPIGVSCRICARVDCMARREPSALAEGL